jgi:hypothetical protein
MRTCGRRWRSTPIARQREKENKKSSGRHTSSPATQQKPWTVIGGWGWPEQSYRASVGGEDGRDGDVALRKKMTVTVDGGIESKTGRKEKFKKVQTLTADAISWPRTSISLQGCADMGEDARCAARPVG